MILYFGSFTHTLSLVGPGDSRFKTEFHGYDEEMFQYIFHTSSKVLFPAQRLHLIKCDHLGRPDTDGTYDREHANRKLYWKEDVHEIKREWDALKEDAETSSGGAQFEKWKAERAEPLESLSEVTTPFSMQKSSGMASNRLSS